MAQSTTAQSPISDVGSYKLLVDGTILSQEYQVVSIDVQRSFNKIASARLLILDGDPAKQLFKISNNELAFTPGKVIEIKLGYHEKDFSVFKGIIIRHSIRSKKKKQSFLILEAKESPIKMTIGRKNRSFYGKSDFEICGELTDNYGLKLEMDKTNFKHPEMIQHSVTDWDFLVFRAEMNGMLVLTEGETLKIKKPGIASTATKSYTFGRDGIFEIEAEIDARTQFQKIIAQSWNYKSQALEHSDSGESNFTGAGDFTEIILAKAMGLKELVLTHTGNLAEEQLKSWSDTYEMRSRLAKIQGRIKVQGLPDLKPGDTIDIQGLSNKFNGKMLVCGIYQQFAISNWETDIQFGMPVDWISNEPELIAKPASGISSGIQGMQIGIVVKLEDPNGEDRVQVKIPFIASDEGMWARMASLDAGSGRGAFFRPEIGDEVLLGFLNNDPSFPVILGMLNSSAKPAPLKAADANDEKGFVTRSGFKMIFNDSDKSYTLTSPGGKSVIISDKGDELTLKDEHANKISLSASGISIESCKDLSLKAASGQLSIDAVNITGTATAKFSASGNGSLSLSSSGVSMLKGSMVQIN